MATTPRPWYRSPTLWFFLPGLVFLLWAWVFSMQREAITLARADAVKAEENV